MSAADTSDSSDNEATEIDHELAPKTITNNNNTSTMSSSNFQSAQLKSQNSTSHTTNISSASSSSTSQSASATTPLSTSATIHQSSTKSQPTTTNSQQSILSPLMYQTPQGMMYATPSNGGVIFSLAQSDAAPQFITIPLSVIPANGQGELDLSKRK